MRHTFRYRVDAELAPGAEVVLSTDDSHHLTRVVRRRPGDGVEVIGADGRLWSCEVVQVSDAAVLRVVERAHDAPVAPPVSLWVGLAEAGRLDMVVEKAVELGVREVGVMTTARARRVPDGGAWERRVMRMARVAEAAARQSGRGTWASPGALVPFDHVLRQTVPGEGIILDPRAIASLADVLRVRPAASPVTLLIGPDTGFSAAEVDAAVEAGLVTARLGSGMLRCETAAVTAAALATVGRE